VVTSRRSRASAFGTWGRRNNRVRAIGVALLVSVFLLSTLGGVAVAGPAPHSLTASAAAGTSPAPTRPEGVPSIHPTPAAAGIDSVVDILNPVTNQLVPGNHSPAVQADPQIVVYDPANGDLYVRGDLGETISVVNATTDQVLTSLPVGSAGSSYIPNVPTIAVDPTTDLVYETNSVLETVGIINGTTNTLTGSIGLGAGPGGIVFDPTSGNFYTSNWNSNNVSVVSGVTNRFVTGIPVGREPGALLYDANANEVFVSNFDSGNVSVIDAATNTVIANPTTGLPTSEPVALTLDTADDLVAVVNSLTSNITVIDGSTNVVSASIFLGANAIPTSASFDPSADTFLVANGGATVHNVTTITEPGSTPGGSIEIGSGAQGAAYDVHSGDLYVANYESNNVSVVGLPAGVITETVPTANFPEALAVDTSTGSVFVANEGDDSSDANLTVIAWPGLGYGVSIKLVVYPTALTAAPNGNVYATDYGGSDALIVNESTNQVTGTASAPTEPGDSAYVPSSGYFYIASQPYGTVDVDTATGTFVAAVVPLGFDSSGVAYDPADADVYVSNYYGGNITVIDAASHTVTDVITIRPYDSLGAEIYDPANSTVLVANYNYHNVTVVQGTTVVDTIPVGLEPTGFAYDPANNTIFVANYGSGNISVINATTDQIVHVFASPEPEYLTYDTDSNAVYVASAEGGAVYAFNASTYQVLGPAVDISGNYGSGGIAYGATSGDVYVATDTGSSIAILSNVSVFPVSFEETGLPSGTTWSVTLGGASNDSTTSTVGFVEPNGPYSFTVAPVTGYTANVTTGSVTVANAPVVVQILFSPANYTVTFVESGLASGTSWSVTLGTSTEHSTVTTVVFSEPNGMYDYSVGAVAGYSITPPATGTVTVEDTSQSVDVTFTPVAGTYTIDFVESGLPSGTNWSVTVGTSTRSSVTNTVVFTEPDGSYPFTVGAVAGYTASATPASPAVVSGANDVVDVTYTSSAPAPAGSTGLSPLEWALLAVVVIVILAVAFLLIGRRRKKENAPPGPNAPPPPPPAPPPT